MPAKNAIKVYVKDGFYHLYNRGVEKRPIFLEERDYKTFLYYLKNYLSPPCPNQKHPTRRSDLHEQIQLIAYCLMPNHFHFLVKQLTERAIIKFMRCLSNSYVRYFNEYHERTGPLFQGRYRAVLIETEPHLLHLTRYIHINPNDLGPNRSDLQEYSYSSYADYLGKRKTRWVHPEKILAFFKTAQRTSLKDILSYQSFIEDYLEDSKEVLGDLTLE